MIIKSCKTDKLGFLMNIKYAISFLKSEIPILSMKALRSPKGTISHFEYSRDPAGIMTQRQSFL